MKVLCVLLVFALASELGFCQSAKPEQKQDDKVIVIEKKANRKYNLTATFYGTNFRYGKNDEKESKIVTHIVFRDDKTGAEVRYEPTGQIPAGEFYFTEIWSPDEEYLVLPIGTFEGFGIFKTETALQNIRSNKFYDAIKVKSENSGWFGHNFEKWENDSTFSFRAGLDGDMFAFKYNLASSELYCYRTKCEEFDIGINNRGEIKPTRKGDIAPTKIH